MSARSTDARGVLALAPLLAVVAAGCDFTAFDTYRADTPVLALGEPTDYPDLSFALELGYAGGDAAGGDYVITSGGLGEATIALPVRVGSALAPHTPPATLLCSGAAPCGGTTATGSALAGLGAWSGATSCALSGEFGAVHRVHVACLGGGATTGFELTPPAGFETSGFGLGIATPRRRAGEGPTADLALVGAPEQTPAMTSTMATGAIFLATPAGVTNVTPAGVIPGSALGTALAIGRARAGAGTERVVVAGGAQTGLAYVLRGSASAMRLVGCVAHSDEQGFGGAVALGDFDGDGDDDVAVGDDGALVGRQARVHVYLAANAPDAPGCSASAWPETRVDCATVVSGGFACAGGSEGFGASLAAGDLDGDGRDELVVGAPVATVGGAAGAGAIVVLGAHGSGAGFGFETTGHVVQLASPVEAAALGSRVLVDRVDGRDELFATAPGARTVYVFLCTGLAGDSPNAPSLDARCRPRT